MSRLEKIAFTGIMVWVMGCALSVAVVLAVTYFTPMWLLTPPAGGVFALWVSMHIKAWCE